MFLKSLFYKTDTEQIGPFRLNEKLNILFGRNGVGKSRTIRLINNIFNVHKAPKFKYHGEHRIIIEQDDKEFAYLINGVKIDGKITINQDSLYFADKMLFDREKGQLFNESIANLENYAPVENELSINYVKDTIKYRTIFSVKDYFTRCKFIDNSLPQTQNVLFGAGEDIEGHHSASDTLIKIQENSQAMFDEIKKAFIEIYPQVEDVFVGDFLQGNVKLKVIFIKENRISISYPFFQGSSGMMRALNILTGLFSSSEKAIILIEEIENGLDYHAIVKLCEAIKDASIYKQILVTTHSPLVANIFDLSDWIITERDGGHTKFSNIKEDKELLNKLKLNFTNYSLYTQDLLEFNEQKL